MVTNPQLAHNCTVVLSLADAKCDNYTLNNTKNENHQRSFQLVLFEFPWNTQLAGFGGSKILRLRPVFLVLFEFSPNDELANRK